MQIKLQHQRTAGLFLDYHVSLHNVEGNDMSVHTSVEIIMFHIENKWTGSDKCCDTGVHPKFKIFSFVTLLVATWQMYESVMWKQCYV